jgi:arginyl-tRNA synthetase
MPSITDQLDAAFRKAIRDAFDLDADPLISASANPQFGDYQSNAAMGLAKKVAENTGAKTNPRQIAEQILAKLDLGELASEKPGIAGPGFINVRLNSAWLVAQLNGALADERLNVPLAANPQIVVVDYSAPNVAKEMHVGHLRTTVIGDTYVRVLEFLGNKVIRQNHIGDWGTQFGRVMLGLWYDAVAKQRGDEALLSTWIEKALPLVKGPDGETPDARKARTAAQDAILDQIVPWHQRAIDEDPDGTKIFEPYVEKSVPNLKRLDTLYTFASAVTAFESAASRSVKHPTHGEKSLKELASFFATFVQQQHRKENAQEGRAWKKSVESTLATCQAIYDKLGVKLTPADARGESSYNDALPAVVSDLKAAGIAQVSDGATVVFVEGYEAPLMVQKSNGGYGYGTTDLAAARYRVNTLKADRVIYVVGLPQSQHLAQVFWTTKKAGWDKRDATHTAVFEHTGFGNVLGEDGKILRTRAGGTVKLAELLDEAEERGYAMAKKKNDEAEPDRKLPEDALPAIGHAVGIGGVKYFDLLRDRVGDYKFSFDAMLSLDGNTAPYLQYAHARVCSIFRKGNVVRGSTHVSVLSEPAELTLAKVLLKFENTVEAVARDLKPHFLCTFLYEVACAFSTFFEACPVLKSDEPIRSSRLALCDLTARTIAQGLDLLGIEHPEQM